MTSCSLTMAGDINLVSLVQQLQKLGLRAWKAILGATLQILARPADLAVRCRDVFAHAVTL